MRRIIVVLFVFLTQSYAFSFWSNLHAYITYEAWQLVKYQHPEVINSQMDLHIGSQTYTNPPPPFSSGTITAGAWVEDVSDYLYSIDNFLISCDPTPESNSFTATHFGTQI